MTGYQVHSATWMASGAGVSGAADTLATTIGTLVTALADAGACWGDDDIGRAFFNGDSQAAGFGAVRDLVLSELATMVNLLRATGATLVVSGQQYAIAEQASTVGGYLPSGADAGALSAADPYQLPTLSAGLAESDPPPGVFMEILRLMESLVGGCQYPDGNMSRLANARDAFTAAANAITGIATDVADHAGTVTANNSGAATEKFASFAAALSSGGDQGGLVWLAQACTELAGAVDTLIKEKNATRLQFWYSLEFLLATWAIAMAFSWLTAGASEAGALATTETEGVALRTLVQSVAKTVAKAALGGAFFSGGMDAIGQYTRIHEGLQKGFNTGEFGTAMGEGAIAGAFMGGAGAWVGRAANPVTAKLADWMGTAGVKGTAARFGFAGLTGTAGNVAAQLPTGHVDLAQAAEFGFGMAGIESAKEAGSHSGDQLNNAIRLNDWLDGQKGPDGATPDRGTGDVPADRAPTGPVDRVPDHTGQAPAPADDARPTQTDLASVTHFGADQNGAGHDTDANTGHDTLPANHGTPADHGTPAENSALADHNAPADHSPPPAETDTPPAPAGQDATRAAADPVPARMDAETPGPDPTQPVPDPAQGGRDPTQGAPAGEQPIDRAPAAVGANESSVGPVHAAPDFSSSTTAHDGGAAVPSSDRTPPPPGSDSPGHAPASAEPPAPANPHGTETVGTRPTAHETGSTGDPAQHQGGQVRDALHTDPAPMARPSISDILNPPHHPDPAPADHSGSTVDSVLPVPVGHDGTSSTGPRPDDARHEPAAPVAAPPPPAAPRPAPRGPVMLDRPTLEASLRWAGINETAPAPEVPPEVLRALRPTEPVGPIGSDRPTPDLSRVSGDLRKTLEGPRADGAKLLAQLHGVHQDPAASRRLREEYTAATGRDLLTDITSAYQDGRLPFDPGPYVKHLLPDPEVDFQLRPPTQIEWQNLHDALNARDGARASEVLNRSFSRDPADIQALDSAYHARYGIDLKSHIEAAIDGPEGEYLKYLVGDEHLETPVVSIAEAKALYRQLEAGTFITQSGAEVRIPFGHLEDGCYDRAHRMAMKLTDWGYANQKVFSVRVNPKLQVQTETVARASRGKPQDVSWGYHVASMIKVADVNGNVVDVVIDPSLRRGPLGVDEWLGLMGVTRQDYLRFNLPQDAPGVNSDYINGMVTELLKPQADYTSDTALVYTAPRHKYWASIENKTTPATAHIQATRMQSETEGRARTSEARTLGNEVIDLLDSHPRYSPTGQIVKALVNTIKTDPNYRMLLTDARAGTNWLPDTLGNGSAISLPRRARILKEVYEQLHRGG